MEIVSIIRAMLRHRLLLALGIVPALLVGILSTYSVSLSPAKLTSKQSVVSSASGRVLLQALEAPVVDLGADQDAEFLGPRTLLLADLMATDRARAAIARGAGLKPADLVVISPSMSAVEVRVPLATEATPTAIGGLRALTIAGDGKVPILTFRAGTPDTASARRVVDSAIRTFQGLLTQGPVATGKARQPNTLSAQPLGETVVQTRADGGGKAMGLAAVLIVFAGWAGTIVVFDGGKRPGRRRRLFRARVAGRAQR